MHNCDVPPFVFSVMAEQISCCKEMRFVSLSGVRNIPEFLCTALIEANRDIEGFQMEQCNLGEGDWSEFVDQLDERNNLEYLSFAQTRDLQQIGVLLPYTGTGELDLSNCGLSSVKVSKFDFSFLSVLSLAGNPLTNCFSNLMSRPLFSSSLISLSLTETQLSPQDVRVIGRYLRQELRGLRLLFISFNTLTNCVADLIPSDKPIGLEVLGMQRTSLSREDLRHLKKVMFSGSLPCLSSLDLSENGLSTMEEDLVGLVLFLQRSIHVEAHDHLPQRQWSVRGSPFKDRSYLSRNKCSAHTRESQCKKLDILTL